MKTPRITVLGEASLWAPADHADVSIAVVRRSRDSDEAVRRAAEAYDALDAVLGVHADVIVRRTTTSLGVTQITRWEPDTGRSIPEGFEASRTETVRFSPIAGAGAAVRAALASAPDLTVRGPWFGLEPTNPVHAAVRADAAAAARASAEAYASGLGLTLGPVLALREPGTERTAAFTGEPARLTARMAKADAGADVGGSLLVELTDEDVEVTAAVELVVAIT